jgi:hypothetical protein
MPAHYDSTLPIVSAGNLDGTAAPVAGDTGHLAQLMAQMSACLADPASQSIGTFAQTLQALHAELALMAGQPLGDEVYDWDAILAASEKQAQDADTGSTGGEPVLPFTAEQLAMLTA